MSSTVTIAPEGRMLAQNVMSSTFLLVRGMRDGHQPDVIRGLMAQRQLLMAELARYMNTERQVGSLASLRAAVAESDRTLEALIS